MSKLGEMKKKIIIWSIRGGIKKVIILSQDKKSIINFDNIINIEITDCDEDGFGIFASAIVGVDDNYRELGYYKTEERAIKILIDIFKIYGIYMKLNGGPAIIRGQSDIAPAIFNIPKVYEMPED